MTGGVIPMSVYPEDVQIISGDLEPAPPPEQACGEPHEADAADADRSECPYCGVTSHHQVRRYRFCGHDAS
jgi:hypothetical protein